MPVLVSGSFFAKLDTYKTLDKPGNGDEQPVIASLVSGGFVTAWKSGDSLWLQIYDANGEPSGEPFELAPQGYASPYSPTLTGLSTGGFVVAWETARTPGDSFVGVGVQIFDASGNPVGVPFTANTTTHAGQQQPSAIALTSGVFVVAWTDAGDGSGASIKAQIFNAQGSKVGGEFTVNTNGGPVQYPQTAALPNGGFVVAWVDPFAETVNAQVFDSNGNKVGGQIDCGNVPASTGSLGTLDIAALPSGDVVIVWATAAGEIVGQIFNSSGTLVGGQFQVNAPTVGVEILPEIAVLPSGEFVVAWRAPTDGINYFQIGDVHAQRFSGNGTKIGEKFIVAAGPYGDTEPQITTFGTGDLAVLYMQFDQYGIAKLNLQLLFSAQQGSAADNLMTGTVGRDFFLRLGWQRYYRRPGRQRYANGWQRRRHARGR